MPLPDKWDGIFYDEDTNGDMIFDLEPDDFVATLTNHRSDAEFLVAGAACDLFWNNQRELAEKFMDLGHTMWPKAAWGLLPFIVLTAKNIVKSGADVSAVKTGLNNTVAMFFEGGIAVQVIPQATN